MKKIKGFQDFLNEKNGEGKDPEVMRQHIVIAYDKENSPEDVVFAGEDKDFYNFYVANTAIDDSTEAIKDLERPEIFGDHVSFELLNLTIQLYQEMKKAGIEIPTDAEFIIHIRIAKKHPTGIYNN